MECNMGAEGGNNVKEPRMNKIKRRRSEEDIETFTCREEVYNIAISMIEQSQ